MSILIEKVRIFGFRGLHNVEVSLEQTTVLTGMNNAGKTSFLKALQIALGNSQFISPDDFYMSDTFISDKIIIDLKIIPVDLSGKQVASFGPEWEILFGDDRLITDTDGNSFVPLRTVVVLDPIKSTYKTNQYIQHEWVDYETQEGARFWHETENGSEKSFHFDEIPFYYMDAQRDIIDDMKVRNSYLGKMLSNIKYSPADIRLIEDQIKLLNDQAVNSSDILKNIETTLKELDSAMDNASNGIDITPFPKKVRDLNRGVSIQYSDFSMEYHGMGTRSWSSLLTLKSFISLFAKNSEENQKQFFPIVAIEEPEAHLHPNAQKKLYAQIAGIAGQKIISTHSPYIAASAELGQIRSFYKKEGIVKCGAIITSGLNSEEIRKIERQVVNSRGELFFSKAIVLFEGETEEQALPILASHYFNKSLSEIGVDFIGVGGYGNYLSFIRFAESLNIPWLIFSDADNDVKARVQKQLFDSNSSMLENDCIVFVEDGNDFEKQLLIDNFDSEIKNAIKKDRLLNITNPYQLNAIQPQIDAIGNYSKQKLYEIMTGSKTKYGPLIATEIIKSGKLLSPKIIALFTKLNKILETN